ncbi:subunit alpha of DNA polymerase 3 [Vitreoscilla sp. C1]|nr:subunit alpha of DNA polymerase 3 [Vitreoscilla sp. C1]
MIRIKEVVKHAAAQGFAALGVSDLMNLFGMVKFYKACRSNGIKPIIGVDVWVEDDVGESKDYRLLLIARDADGFRRLSELITRAYVDEERNRMDYRIQASWLADGDNTGLICLSGAHLGNIGQSLLTGRLEEAKAQAQALAALFPNRFYLELQRLPEKPEWEVAVTGSLQLAQDLDLPIVATHPAQFLNKDDFQAHEARVCISSGYVLADTRRPKNFQPSQYFVAADEFEARFADLPEALQNSVAIAKRCNVEIVLGKNFLPQFPTPDSMSLDDYLAHLSNEGLQERMAVLYPNETDREARYPEYQARLDFELKTIINMGFPGYFLIVQDFINWAKQNGCPVGPGRGSGAGSLVAYALKITDLDPLKYALLFERFLNPERVSMPDFDIDFCQANRGRVIHYVRDHYGHEAVSQIVTFGTLSSKAVIRDVGRVLDLPFGLCDRLSKLIPVEQNKPLGLKKAMEAEPQIGELIEAEEAEELMVLAQKLEDLTRGTGMHAGGVLIAPGKITDFCPVYQAQGDDTSPVSMFDKDDVEQAGLVKFDFLGLRNLTIIEMAQNFIKDGVGDIVDVNHIPLDDAPTYKHIFAEGNTTAVFQFESAGMRRMLMEAMPSKFEEIIAFVALYRPGPMDLIPDFIRRMHGEKFEYLDPLLANVLEPTYGIMVYQEQVMQAAQVCGGYTLGGADLLRRAMGKKKVEEMVQHRSIFVEGASKNGIDEKKANEIFDYMEKFAGYGFNKSHAAAYALVSYQTAWLKYHYPAEFMAATMSSELDNTDQLKVFYDDAISKSNGITFLAPSVNHSFYRFQPLPHRQIRYALGAIKGTGEAAVNAIVAARQNGLFTSLFDFCERVGKQHLNKRTVEALIRGGAFDEIEPNRAMLLANVGLAMDYAEQKAVNANQGGLFDMMDDAAMPEVEMVYAAPWNDSEQLAEEKQAIGFYLSGHPFKPYRDVIRGFAKKDLAELKPADHKQWVAGFVTGIRIIMGRRGKMAIATVEDETAKLEVVIAGNSYERFQHLLKADQVLLFECKVARDEYNGGGGLRLNSDGIYDFDGARSAFARNLSLITTPQTDTHRLQALLQSQRGQGYVGLRLAYQHPLVSAELKTSSQWQIGLNSELLQQLSQLLGHEAVNVIW